MKRQLLTGLCLTFGMCCTGLFADDAASAPETRTIGKLAWHTDYAAAYREAREQHRQLFIYFYDPRQPQVKETYEREVLSRPQLAKSLRRVTRAILPLDTRDPAAVAKDPESKKLLIQHRGFRYLQRQHGLVVIDLVNPRDSLFGKTVSAHPFSPGRFYNARTTRTVLGLPRATITQRALVYAVRVHPEAPQSTQGQPNPVLFQQAAHHSSLMAQYGSVGHHDWGNRSSMISSAIGASPSEVAAASFGGENLIEAAKSCVQMWRGSSVHWVMVNAAQGKFGYDMVRTPSGQWYATGIFTGQ